ncbi:MAG: hypothetical protein GF331_25500 [Chitinivibrionales bacterium]|nr:hypothetical protein [Chitinivibrionales bacterium]
MPNDIRIESHDDYLLFVIRGTDSLVFSLQYLRLVGEECRSRGYRKAMVIEDLDGQLTTMDMYHLGEQVTSLLEGVQVALVDTHPSHREGNRFGEIVARNRGARIQLFGDVNRARQWLLGQCGQW